MKIKLFIWIFAWLLIYSQNIYSQDQDTIINFLEGKWEWYKSYLGGFRGGYTTPEHKGYNITIEFDALQNDSVVFTLYKNDAYIWDTITTIFIVDSSISIWGIDKSVIPELRKYFFMIRDFRYLEYLQLWVTESDYIVFNEPSSPESAEHHFIRKTTNFLPQNNYNPEPVFYPNPFIDQLTFKGLTNISLSIEIFTITGRKMFYRNIMHTESHIINTSSMKQGIYLVRILNHDTKEVLLIQRIIKK